MTRIIAGAAGSLRLDVPKSGTRPTSDRVREAIFSTLESWGLIEGSRVLDLYAGSGALALEAVSRGAASATLVERHAQAARVADRNARTVLGAFAGKKDAGKKDAGEKNGHRSRTATDPVAAPSIEVVRQSVQTFLTAASARDPLPAWDVVLIDPPYDLGERELSENLATLVPLLANDAAVLVERSSRSPEPSWPAALVQIRDRRYGETALWWADRADRPAAP
ncbi:MAG: RsmD family RNA methyltransferase [Leucobacter sp.]